MAGAKKFVYRGRDASVVKQHATQTGGAFDSYIDSKIPRYKVEAGENNIRILPPTWDDVETWGENWGIVVWAHNQIGPDNSSFLCLKKMKGEDCALCEARADVEDDEEAANALKPQKRIIAYIIDRDDEKTGPQWWGMPWTVDKEISLRSIDKETNEPLLVDEPDEGYDITFNRDGQGLKTKYNGVDIARKPSPIHDNEKTQNKWLDFIVENPLPDILKWHDCDYMMEVYNGKRSRKDEDADDGKSSRSSRRSSREDANGEERSSKKTTSKKKSKVTQDELDDMEERDLSKLIKTHELDVDASEFDSVRKLRRAVKEALQEADLLESDETEEKEVEETTSRTKRTVKKEVVEEQEEGEGEEEGEDEGKDERPSSSRARSAETEKPRSGGARYVGRGRTDDGDNDDPKPGKRGNPAAKESIDRLRKKHAKDDDD